MLKKRKERTEESIEKTEQRNYVYNIILIVGAEGRKKKVDKGYKYSYIIELVSKSVQKSIKSVQQSVKVSTKSH